LTSLASDVLKIAESETGQLTPQDVPFDLTEIVSHAMVFNSDTAKKQKLELTSKLSKTNPPYVMGAPNHVLEILNWLLSNAVRFTPSAKVHLILDYKVIDDAITARFNVTDTGIGITDKSRIFEHMLQLDESLNRKHDGAGLGLAIAQKLANLMGGQIEVEDNPGGGS